MLDRSDPQTRHCPHCGSSMTHVRLMWERINGKLQCHACRRPDVKWEAR